MELVQPTTPDINEIVKIYAKEKGLSDTAAWALIRGTFVPKSEVLNIIENQNKIAQGQGTQPNKVSELIAQKNEVSIEKMKLEMEFKRMERQDRIDAEEKEQKKIDQAERKRKNELDEARLALDKEVAMRKLELEEKRLNAKDEFDQKLFLMQIGKKPEEAQEIVKNQEKFYERILDERTRHTDEVGDLKEDADRKTKEIKSEMDNRFEKFIKENQNKPASDDFINKMKEYKKMQTEFLDMTFDTLEARGYDKNQLDAMRKVTNVKSKEQEGTIGQLWGIFGPKIKKYIGSAAEKATQELDTAPSGLENRISPEVEKRIRAETEAKARQMEEENALLQRKLEEKKKEYKPCKKSGGVWNPERLNLVSGMTTQRPTSSCSMQ